MWKHRKRTLQGPGTLARIAGHRRSGIGSTPRIMARGRGRYASVQCPNLRSTNTHESEQGREDPGEDPVMRLRWFSRRRWRTWESGFLSTTSRSRRPTTRAHFRRRGDPFGLTQARDNAPTSTRACPGSSLDWGSCERTTCSSRVSIRISAPSAACGCWLAVAVQRSSAQRGAGIKQDERRRCRSEARDVCIQYVVLRVGGQARWAYGVLLVHTVHSRRTTVVLSRVRAGPRPLQAIEQPLSLEDPKIPQTLPRACCTSVQKCPTPDSCVVVHSTARSSLRPTVALCDHQLCLGR